MFTFYCGCIGEEWAGEDNMKELVSVNPEEMNCTPQKLSPHLYFAMAVCVRFAAIFLVGVGGIFPQGFYNKSIMFSKTWQSCGSL